MKIKELEVKNDFLNLDTNLYEELKSTALNKAFLISYNKKMFDEISLDYDEANNEDFVKFINGEILLKNSKPYSMVYAGHQFGYFVSQLGDGRAINLGSISSWHLQTKGSGLTKYSRQGDGRAVLRSSIREYIISEAMHALDIPSTRVLAIIGSQHEVYRYYGDIEYGSVVLRMSESWIRFGTFEYYAKTKDNKKNVKELCDFVIKENYAHLINEENKYEKMFFELVDKTALLLAKWQTYGFMHGVMNTDNMSMAGLTIDYGPFAFMDYFDKHNICNHTDTQGRYSYNNQPYIAKWNLNVLIDSLESICDVSKLKEYLKTFLSKHENMYLELMSNRLGLDIKNSKDNNIELIRNLLNSFQNAKTDYNSFFYELFKLESFEDVSGVLDTCIHKEHIEKWLKEYEIAFNADKSLFKTKKDLMRKSNPKYIIKNYMLQDAINKANNGDYTLVNDLLDIAQNPYDEHAKYDYYSKATPLKHANLRLSCSS